MENKESENQQAVDQIYDYAANLLVKENKSPTEVKKALMEEGVDEESSSIIVENLENQINKVKKDQANKDMLYGALWCVGGIVMTVADVGYIFWGAIVFGGYQFLKGAMNS
jgi:hypothetical protein